MRSVYVDFDDVLCETGRGFLEVLEREFGRSVEFEDIVSYDLGQSFDLSPSDLDRFMDVAHRDDVLLALEPMAGAIETLAEWAAAGYRLDIVTGRPPATSEVSRRWLALHDVPHDGLFFVEKYAHSQPVGEGPAPLALEDLSRDYCLAIEDSRSTASYLAGSLGLEVALFDRPWNRNGAGPLPANVTRCGCWSELRRRFARP